MNENTLRQNLLKPDVAIRYKFLYDSTDYTDLITDRGITISRDVNLSAGLTPIWVNNSGGWWNFLHETNLALGETAEIQLYVSGDAANALTLFKGFVKDPVFEGTLVRLMLKDHASAWLERKVGSNETPATWFLGNATSSAEMRAWKLLTDASYGNLDDTDDPSNTDIDYTSFAAWRDNHINTYSYHLFGLPTGQTVGELLMMICQLTHSFIWVNNDGKVAFAPPYQPGYTYDEGNTGIKGKPGQGRDLEIVTQNIINDITVRYTYDTTTGDWSGSVNDTEALSITQFGLFPRVVEGRIMWHRYVASANADRNATKAAYSTPMRFFNITAGIPAIMEDLCNQITVSDTLKNITDANCYIEAVNYDLNTFEVRMKARWPW